MEKAIKTSSCKIQVIENSFITPQTDEEQILSLSFLDIKWIHFHPIQRLVFYAFPCSKSTFLETLVPRFKSSLSKTLEHYLPLAGNLYYPNPTHEPDSDVAPPEIRFQPGDSLSLTVAEYSDDSVEERFNHLAGSGQRDCDEFYDLLPDFPSTKIEEGFTVIPLMAVQITLFPGAGISLGFVNSHVVGDASSVVGFIKAWSKVAVSSEEEEDGGGDVLARNGLLPISDRSLLKLPKGIKDSLWEKMKSVEYKPKPTKNVPTNKVRATFTLSKNVIDRLKTLTRSEKPNLTHLSSVAVTVAYAWSCLSNAAADAGEEQPHDGEEEYLLMPVDVRQRLDPPIPSSYFGNCILPAFAKAEHGRLKGELGFFEAVEVISGMIADIGRKKDDLFKDLDRQGEVFRSLIGKRVLAISGSPKFDLYDVDFGWGKPKKYESVSIDRERTAMSLSKSAEFDGGLEIGLSLEKKKMDAFAECFYGGLLKDLKV